MARFEPESSGIGRDRSANCATTTAHTFGMDSTVPYFPLKTSVGNLISILRSKIKSLDL